MGILYPEYTNVSTLTPFPPGKLSEVISPGHGKKLFAGFSAFILHSIACPFISISSCVKDSFSP